MSFQANEDFLLAAAFEDDVKGVLDMRPYLGCGDST